MKFKVGDRVYFRDRLAVADAARWPGTIEKTFSWSSLPYEVHLDAGSVYRRAEEQELTPMHRTYVAGPMSGIPSFNIPAFDAAATDLRAAGLDVVSPAELDDPVVREMEIGSPDGSMDDLVEALTEEGITMSWGEFLARDVRLIANEGIDSITVLPGWWKSRGARLEVTVATLDDKPIYAYDPDAPGLRRQLSLEEVDAGKLGRHPSSAIQEAGRPLSIVTEAGGNPKDQAAKAEGKVRLDLLEPAANEAAARALEFGAVTKGYGVQNYRTVPITYRTYLAAIQRHLDALKELEDDAPDSGLHHMAHILANGHVFFGAVSAGTLVDDRGPGPVGPNPVNTALKEES